MEGIVAKEKSGLYLPGKRSKSWLKVKEVRESEFVVGGYTFRGVRNEYFNTLLLGMYDSDGQLIFVGEVGAGISRSVAKGLSQMLQEFHSGEHPFASLPNVQKFISGVARSWYVRWSTVSSPRTESLPIQCSKLSETTSLRQNA